MKSLPSLLALATFLASSLLLTACSSPDVADARQSGVDRRQDRIDARSSARTDRWSERAAREDARSKARFDSW